VVRGRAARQPTSNISYGPFALTSMRPRTGAPAAFGALAQLILGPAHPLSIVLDVATVDVREANEVTLAGPVQSRQVPHCCWTVPTVGLRL
jgi:hypothetical protein